MKIKVNLPVLDKLKNLFCESDEQIISRAQQIVNNSDTGKKKEDAEQIQNQVAEIICDTDTYRPTGESNYISRITTQYISERIPVRDLDDALRLLIMHPGAQISSDKAGLYGK